MIKLRNILKIALMYAAWLLYRFRKASQPISGSEPRRICVLYLSGLGDILCASFFFRQLRERFPDAVISACLPAGFIDLQQKYFRFDEYIAHTGYRATLRQIRKLQPDLIILPGWLLRNSVLALLSNARAVLGYINDLSFSNHFLNRFKLEAVGREVEESWIDMRSCHLSERPALISESLGIRPFKAGDADISRMKIAEDHAVIHAGGEFVGKRWPPGQYAEIINHLLESGICGKVYLIGDSLDAKVNAAILSLASSPGTIDMAGKLSLVQSQDLIARAKLFIGNDSGPMHIAALSGVPTLGLMGPYLSRISGPLGENSRSLGYVFPCSGCDQRGCKYDYRCIKAITTEEVVATIREMTGHAQD
ncbi:MAG: glycosyltransferase family 9 protein [Candidatus Syntrophosphaera sp.]|nr:glycosyltransferase family 9 protein [Candidatus Syntrophosphaera sp.]